MKLFPAIDLYDGCAVRLLRGDYDKMTVYSRDPAAVARSFAAAGAEWLHVVDLQGARDGAAANLETVRALIGVGLKTEIGGGVRDLDAIERYLSAGAMRVILGTAALTDKDFVPRAVRAFGGERIAVGVDLRDGFVAIHGWTETSAVRGDEFCLKMQAEGVKTVICTDVSKDGMLAGANAELYRSLSKLLAIDIVASGGVSTLDDVRALRDMGLSGAILGKALYTGALDLKQALRCAEGTA